MKETGLMFKAPLVRAILEGHKTQTRRLVKPQPVDGQGMVNAAYCGHPNLWLRDGPCDETDPTYEWRCPMGQPGDRIYVRETWADLIAVSPSTDEPMAIGPGERLIEAPTSWTDDKGRTRWHFDGQVIAYRANSNVEFCDGDGFTGEFADKSDMPRWRPSIHMPKDFARIWLEITSVRAVRLQSITEADCIAEGAAGGHGSIPGYQYSTTPLEHFRHIWESTGADWDANPWVWVIDFKTISTTGRPA